MKKVISILCAAFCICCVSCNKNEKSKAPDNIIGKWSSVNIDYLDEYNRVEAREATNDYSLEISEESIRFILEEGPEGINEFVSSYNYKEGDDSVIGCDSLYQEYGMMITIKISKDKKQITLYQTATRWDWGHHANSARWLA